MLFIYRDEVYDQESPDRGIAELILSKQRNGPIGSTKLQFDQTHGRFHNLTRSEMPPPVTSGFQDPDPGDDWGPPREGGGGGEPPF